MVIQRQKLIARFGLGCCPDVMFRYRRMLCGPMPEEDAKAEAPIGFFRGQLSGAMPQVMHPSVRETVVQALLTIAVCDSWTRIAAHQSVVATHVRMTLFCPFPKCLFNDCLLLVSVIDGCHVVAYKAQNP